MKVLRLLAYTFLLIIGLPACQDDDDSIYIPDKEIRISFPFEILASNDTTYLHPYVYTYLKGFNKNDYSKLDSIYLVCAISTYSLSDTAYARLFNITDGIGIIGSEIIQSTDGSIMHEWRMSGNIIDKLPDSDIDLAIELKVSSNHANLRGAYLKLIRK